MPFRVLLVEDDEEDYRVTRELLREVPDGSFELEWASSYEGAVSQIHAATYDAFLVDYRLGRRSGLDLLCGALQGGRVGPVIILTGHDSHDVDAEARRFGAAGYLVKSELSGRHLARTLHYAIENFSAKTAEPAEGPAPAFDAWAPRQGRVIALIGAKGGVGTTTVAANLACALRSRGPAVIAMEMRGDHGGLSGLLQVAPLGTIAALLKLDPDAIDDACFQATLAIQPDGLRVLAAPQLVEDFVEIRAEHARSIVEAGRRHADIVVVDLPAGASAANREVLGLADVVAIVIEKEPSSVTAARATLSLFESWQVRAPVGSVVVSRANIADAKSVALINSELGVKRFGVVPCAPELFHKSALAREPVVLRHPAHPAGRSLDELAQLLIKQPGNSRRARPTVAVGTN